MLLRWTAVEILSYAVAGSDVMNRKWCERGTAACGQSINNTEKNLLVWGAATMLEVLWTLLDLLHEVQHLCTSHMACWQWDSCRPSSDNYINRHLPLSAASINLHNERLWNMLTNQKIWTNELQDSSTRTGVHVQQGQDQTLTLLRLVYCADPVRSPSAHSLCCSRRRSFNSF